MENRQIKFRMDVNFVNLKIIKIWGIFCFFFNLERKTIFLNKFILGMNAYKVYQDGILTKKATFKELWQCE